MAGNAESVAGVVLAGGRSSRMGQDKAGLICRGHTLLDHAKDLLRRSGLSDVHVSNSDGIADEWTGRGPLAGIHATLKALGERYAFLLYVPVDMPSLTPDLLRDLVDTIDDFPVVRFTGFSLPFRLRTDTKWIGIIDTMLRSGEKGSIKSFQQRIGAMERAFPHDAAACFANVNTPEEWQRLEQDAFEKDVQ